MGEVLFNEYQDLSLYFYLLKKAIYNMKNNYFNYLLNEHTNLLNEEIDNSYFIISKILYETEFIPLVPMDDNRVGDALLIRKEYHETILNEYHFVINKTCNVLELLIGISKRMAHELFRSNEEMSDKECVFELISNLGLDRYTDNYLMNVIKRPKIINQKINNIILDFISRRYEYNGNGNIFPIKNPKEDQRNVEIWYQMMAYLIEKMSIFRRF